MNYLIDIDGTITEDIPNEEPWRMATCKPFEHAVEVINNLYEDGHVITFFTSRTDEHRQVTEEWFASYGFKYHSLLMNKPRGGNYVWIDNHVVIGQLYKSGFWECLLSA